MKKIVILGASESGIGAAHLAKTIGHFQIFVSDKGNIKANYKQELQDAGIEFEEGQHSIARILAADEVVKSPGIPNHISLIQQIKAVGIPVISEIEFASRYTDAKIIAITGSNGKTTTTSLLYHMLKKADLKVGLGGNIGISFAREVAKGVKYDYYVLEVSSFQLDDIQNFKPYISILLNITPDHLDRYDYKFENYAAAKMLITKNQAANNHFIYWKEDATITQFLAKNNTQLKAQALTFSANPSAIKKEVQAYIQDNYFHLKAPSKSAKIRISCLAIKGLHNQLNAMSAGLAAQLLDLTTQQIADGLATFNSLEHRLESIGNIKGVEFINDSKATNTNSTWYALDSMTKPIIWIVGGQDKGNDYGELYSLVAKKVKAIICLCKDSQKIHAAFANTVSAIRDTESADSAVQIACELAQLGDVVLLSPACASFDLFTNYKDRGWQFKQAVQKRQESI